MRQLRGLKKRALGFESLESRWLMAGNISAWINGIGQLNISGDASANAFEIRGTGVPGEALVTPLSDVATGQPTTLNGGTAPILLTGLTSSVGISVFAGNDEVYIKDLIVPGDLNIIGAQGQDTIRIGNWVAYGTQGTGDVSVGGLLRILEAGETSASEGDTIFLGRVTANEIDIRTRFGNDYIEVYNATSIGDGAFQAMFLDGGEDSDVLNLAYMTVHGYMALYGDQITSGNDLISMITSVIYGKAYVDVYLGTNTVALNANSFLGGLEIYTDTGVNNVTLTNSICQKVTIATFNGSDTIRVEGNKVSDVLRIVSRGGYDNIRVQANEIVSLSLDAGSDSDLATVNYNWVWGFANILGGSGYDLLSMSGNAFVGGYWEDFEA